MVYRPNKNKKLRVFSFTCETKLKITWYSCLQAKQDHTLTFDLQPGFEGVCKNGKHFWRERERERGSRSVFATSRRLPVQSGVLRFLFGWLVGHFGFPSSQQHLYAEHCPFRGDCHFGILVCRQQVSAATLCFPMVTKQTQS